MTSVANRLCSQTYLSFLSPHPSQPYHFSIPHQSTRFGQFIFTVVFLMGCVLISNWDMKHHKCVTGRVWLLHITYHRPAESGCSSLHTTDQQSLVAPHYTPQTSRVWLLLITHHRPAESGCSSLHTTDQQSLVAPHYTPQTSRVWLLLITHHRPTNIIHIFNIGITTIPLV
jgi:hypothetical protein